MGHLPGAFTVAPPTLAAILSESLPPSIAIPSCDIMLHISTHVSYRAAPGNQNSGDWLVNSKSGNSAMESMYRGAKWSKCKLKESDVK